jgi:hypothetical protein
MMDTGSGADVLKRTLATRNKKINISRIARDVGLPVEALEAWLFNSAQARLAPEYMKKLAAVLYHGAGYDEVTDKLVPARKTEPTPLCAPDYVQPFNPAMAPYGVWDGKKPVSGPQDMTPGPPVSGKVKPPPGWSSSE